MYVSRVIAGDECLSKAWVVPTDVPTESRSVAFACLNTLCHSRISELVFRDEDNLRFWVVRRLSRARTVVEMETDAKRLRQRQRGALDCGLEANRSFLLIRRRGRSTPPRAHRVRSLTGYNAVGVSPQ